MLLFLKRFHKFKVTLAKRLDSTSAYQDTRGGWALVAAGEVGVWVGGGVRASAAPVLAGHSSTLEASGGHHVSLGVPAVCKAASPRNKGTRLAPEAPVFSLCHVAA